MLFDNRQSMHAMMASEWLSAGGTNALNDQRLELVKMTDEELADEEIKCWELDDNQFFDRDMLVKAFADLREEMMAT
jgi:hypothetical protein